MIYITDNKELKDEKIFEKLKNFGFKFHNLKFGEPISKKYYYDGHYFYNLIERRKYD
jgi:hypothetical protein